MEKGLRERGAIARFAKRGGRGGGILKEANPAETARRGGASAAELGEINDIQAICTPIYCSAAFLVQVKLSANALSPQVSFSQMTLRISEPPNLRTSAVICG